MKSLLFCVVSSIYMWFPVVGSSTSFDALAPQGGEGNGKCCVVHGGQLCSDYPTGEGCLGNLPWQCSCSNPGGSCWMVIIPPTNHDVCRKIAPPVPAEAWCNTVNTWCWTRKAGGTCDNDGGPWSWGGFCTTCGCVGWETGNEILEGTRAACQAGSSNC